MDYEKFTEASGTSSQKKGGISNDKEYFLYMN